MVADIFRNSVDALAQLHLDHLEHQFLGGGWQVFPHNALLLSHQAVYRLGDHGRGVVEEMGLHLLHVDGLHNGVQADDPGVDARRPNGIACDTPVEQQIARENVR